MFLKILDRVEETEFSKLWLSFYGNYPIPVWEKQLSLSLLTRGRSPSYGYLGADKWQERLLAAFETSTFDIPTQRVIVAAFVRHLEKRNPFAARDYAADVLMMANEYLRLGKKVSRAPQWLIDGSPAPDKLEP